MAGLKDCEVGGNVKMSDDHVIRSCLQKRSLDFLLLGEKKEKIFSTSTQ
jgi:hypothetical protein